MQNSKNNSIGLKLLLSTMAVILFGTAQAQAPQGFISRLIEIKYTTELYLSHAIKKGSTQSSMDTALANYNTLRWKVDGLVYQISSDMITRNSPAVMRKLDAWSYEQERNRLSIYNAPNPIKNYAQNFIEIEAIYKETVVPQIYPNNKRTLNLTTNVFYLLKDSYSIVKGLSDMKTRKVMALVELLDHARLMGPGEVVKMGK